MPFSPIDGVETLKRIKDINKDANCVMVTRIYEGDSLTKTKAPGALHYITKPFELEELDKCIEEVKQKQKHRGIYGLIFYRKTKSCSFK